MTMTLSHEALEQFRQILKEREQSLREEIHQALLKADSEHYADLAGQVHDTEEASVADMLVDLNLATIDKYVEELRQVERVLGRMQEGEYGVCIDCGGPIGEPRLRANPVALRCVRCQEAWEKTHAGGETPAL
ncbi:MAG TPA: TraR/DksA family transcriptional regulator [Thiolapillus brandeum]|uniref:TraR/DksA family transcriptional regulator n=1 Tax=Thiolapillus brandeum TaxID=1076588 RepID=A0A7C5IYZ4_9GAMM|nr:TraR/DksA family transcriptional regulator [Thiolapillus brandeum]